MIEAKVLELHQQRTLALAAVAPGTAEDQMITPVLLVADVQESDSGRQKPKKSKTFPVVLFDSFLRLHGFAPVGKVDNSW